MSSRASRAARRAAREAAPAPTPEPFRISGWIALAAVAVTPLALLPGVFISHDVIPKLAMLALAAALLLMLYPQWSQALQALRERPEGNIFLILVAAQIV